VPDMDSKPIEEHQKKTKEMIDRQNELIRNIDAKLNLDDKYITKRKPNDFDSIKAVDEEETNDNDETKLIIQNDLENEKFDPQALRQKLFNRALEKVRLKSDEALGITTPENIKHLITPIIKPSTVLVTEESTSTKEVFGKIFDQAKEKVKNQIQRDKEKSVESLPSSSSSSTKNSPAPIATFDDLDDFNIDEDNTDSSNNKSETSSKFNSTTKTDSTILTQNSINSLKSQEQQQTLITPLLPKPNNNSENENTKGKNLKFVFNSLSTTTSENSSEQQISPVIQKKSNLKSKLSKLLSPSENLKSSSTSPSRSPRETKIKQTGGILKRKSPNNRNNTETEHQKEEPEASNSFAFTVTHSPRLGRNSRTVKRQQNEEKRLERLDKEKRDKRLRMSQEIQRKLDEVETKLSELEHDGVELEKVICSMDGENREKEKLEIKLYNLIHQKNLFQRVENELNIQ
jgi:hypothetical protein